MLLSYDEVNEILNKGWFDSFLGVSLYIRGHLIEEKYLPIHFVDQMLGENLDLQELINYINNPTGYDICKIRLYLKEGKNHDRYEVNSEITYKQILEIRESLKGSIVPMIIKSCFREMLHLLVD